MSDGADGANGHDPDDDALEPTLADLLDDLASEFPDVERREGPEGVDFLVGALQFARLTGVAAQFRLRPEIAEAAIRTPAVTASTLGREWVMFGPKGLDQYSLDRAQSWFELGHRLAAEAAGGRPKRH
jgi:hypothetical protein